MRALSCLLLLAALLGFAQAGIITLSGTRGVSLETSRIWAERSAATGVVAAYSFDDDITGYVDGSNGTRGFHDTTEYAEGGGALRFDLLSGEASANIAGSWTVSSSPYAFTQGFGEGDTFYVQYRARISASMLSNLSQWDSVWKQVIIHQDNATCAGMELTHVHPDSGSTMYTDCGSRHMYTETDSPDHTEDSPLLTQQSWDLSSGPSWTTEAGGVTSEYPAVTWEPPADEWYTVYIKARVGALTEGGTSGNDSTIEMWTQEGEVDAWKKILAVQMPLLYDSDDGDVYNNLTLTPYMTDLSTSASSDAFMWIDSLIISSEEIARPPLP